MRKTIFISIVVAGPSSRVWRSTSSSVAGPPLAGVLASSANGLTHAGAGPSTMWGCARAGAWTIGAGVGADWANAAPPAETAPATANAMGEIARFMPAPLAASRLPLARNFPAPRGDVHNE